MEHSKDKEMVADAATKARDTGAAIARKVQEFIARHRHCSSSSAALA